MDRAATINAETAVTGVIAMATGISSRQPRSRSLAAPTLRLPLRHPMRRKVASKGQTANQTEIGTPTGGTIVRGLKVATMTTGAMIARTRVVARVVMTIARDVVTMAAGVKTVARRN
jgi:hypothetical protein